MSTAASTSKKEQTERLRRNEQKWTKPMMEAGWTVLPSTILNHQQALGLDSLDINILMQLASQWWFSDNPAHPTKRQMAARMRVDPSTVRRRIAALEARSYIRRVPRFDPSNGRQEGNFYLFDGLIAAARPFADADIIERKERKETKDRRAAARAAVGVGTAPAAAPLTVIHGGKVSG